MRKMLDRKHIFLAAKISLAELARGKATHPRSAKMWKSFVTLSRQAEGVKGRA